MPQKLAQSVENNFTKGLITEATALNFPENAVTDADNCEFTYIGEVVRRLGIDYEENYATNAISTAGKAINTYRWTNAGGDGITQILVVQAGVLLHFFNITDATNASPISQHKLDTVVSLSDYLQVSSLEAEVKECQFADGNGYLFVFHPNSDPIYCSYNSANSDITPNVINIKIRDFVGAKENPQYPVDFRPTVPYDAHIYNLQNQGWSKGDSKTAIQTSPTTGPLIGTGIKIFNVPAGLTFTNGDLVSISNTVPILYISSGSQVMTGTVIGYSGTTLTVNVTAIDPRAASYDGSPYSITTINRGYMNTWNTLIGNYPSNSDLWWYFKNASGVFDPTGTIANVTLSTGNAPRGHYILSAFNQYRATISAVPQLNDIVTDARPKTGAWFQGRVWYAGVDASAQPDATTDFYSWASNIYFSQVVNTPSDFGNCFQVNDPTSENLNGILPTDGGVIVIPEAGSIYKLFTIQNGLLVFAANGVWFITGSTGIGFTANDYTITKLSSVPSISGTSFVDVLGLPYFWNEDGIYAVLPQQGGSLAVTPVTLYTIDSFYAEIPTSCKKLARGAYNPVEFTLQWVYRDTEPSDLTDAYRFNRQLNFNTYLKSFYPYSVPSDASYIAGINYISGPGGFNTPDPAFRYLTVIAPDTTTLSHQWDEDYVDWASSGTEEDYESYFVTGYRLRGAAITQFQPQYIQLYRRVDGGPSAYKIQGIWDYANDRNSNRWSSVETVNTGLSRFDTLYRRHKIRGRGYALQIKISSLTGKPFNIQGWSVIDTVNQGV